MAEPARVGMVFVHSSDELYGADRMLLELYAALAPDDRDRAEFWLPTDLEHPAHPLCEELLRRGAAVRHVPLPVLRRADLRPRGLVALLGRSWRVLHELRRRRPDTVYCTTSATFPVAVLARLVRVPHVVGHLQELWSRSDRVALGALATACHRLLAISRPVADQVPGPLRARTVVVPNATAEPESLVPLAGRTGPLHFVVASRWNGWKGHHTLLAAWDRLAEPGTLTVLGGPPASGASVDVRALAEGLRHPGSVHVVGEVPDPQPHVEAADVLIVPSDQPEPFGLVAIEAFARGRPVVGSDAGGLADIVTDGQDGWLFPPGDVDALTAVLARLTRPEVETAGGRARTTYEQRFTTRRYAEEWRAAVSRRR